MYHEKIILYGNSLHKLYIIRELSVWIFSLQWIDGLSENFESFEILLLYLGHGY